MVAAVFMTSPNAKQIFSQFQNLSNELRGPAITMLQREVGRGYQTALRRRVHVISGRLRNSIRFQPGGKSTTGIRMLIYGGIENLRAKESTKSKNANPPPHDFINMTIRFDGNRIFQLGARRVMQRIRMITGAK